MPIPAIAGSGGEQKRGPGRPPGSGSGKKTGQGSAEDTDTLALLIGAGVELLGSIAVANRGPHWSSVAAQAATIGKLSAKLIDKHFPAVAIAKYADEIALLVAAGQAIGPALLVELAHMMSQEAAQKEARSDDAGAGTPAGGDDRRGGGPFPLRVARNPGERGQQPFVSYGVKDDLAPIV